MTMAFHGGEYCVKSYDHDSSHDPCARAGIIPGVALHPGPPVAESATGCASDACGTRVGLAVAFGSFIIEEGVSSVRAA